MDRKVGVVFVLAFALISLASAQVTVDTIRPVTVMRNETFTIEIEISTTEAQTSFDVIQFLPLQWEVLSWEVSGYERADIFYEFSGQQIFAARDRAAAHWRFTKGLSNDVTITLQTRPVAGEQLYAEFITVWTYPGGFNSKSYILTVLPGVGVPFCGNTFCDPGENIFTCPQDCPTQIELLPIDLTLIIVSAIISVTIIAVVYKFRFQKGRERMRLEKERLALEDLRAYLSLGLRRGYTVREMTEALRGAGYDVSLIEEIIRTSGLPDHVSLRKVLKKEPELAEPVPPMEHEEEIPPDEFQERLNEVISGLKRGADIEDTIDLNEIPMAVPVKEVKKNIKRALGQKRKAVLEKEVRKLLKKPKAKARPGKLLASLPIRKRRRVPPDDEVIAKLKRVMNSLNAANKTHIYKKLKGNRKI
jgi:hypothetical protein